MGAFRTYFECFGEAGDVLGSYVPVLLEPNFVMLKLLYLQIRIHTTKVMAVLLQIWAASRVHVY